MLLLIEEPKCVFIHILKNGGTSLTHRKNGVFKVEDKAFGKLPEDWKDLFKFGFVRNPYDRFISAWHYSKRGIGHKLRNIHEFFELITDESIKYEKSGHWEEIMRHHTLPQVHPYYGLQFADFIGRFENYQEDFNIVCDKLEIPRVQLPHLNETVHNHYSKYYKKELLDKVTEYYKEDLDHFGYTFETEE